MPHSAALALTAVLAATSAAVPPPGGVPDLAAMTLDPGDVSGGARVVRQGYVRPSGAIAEYDRTLVPAGRRVGGSGVIRVESDVELERSADAVDASLALVLAFGDDPDVFKAAAHEAAAYLPQRLRGKVTGIRRQRVRAWRVSGRGVVAWSFSMRVRRARYRAFATVTPVGRAVGSLLVLSTPGGTVRVRDVQALIAATVARMKATLAPHNTVAPAITGTPQVGLPLRASQGTWDPLVRPRRFAVQWQHCTAAGESCTDVPGATGESYNVGLADAGGSVRVVVTATNRAGSTAAASAPVVVG
jgi:hypothetical protein